MLGYSKCGNIMVIVEFNYQDTIYNSEEPYCVSAIIKDMYNIIDPSKKYFKLGSQNNKYRLGELKENILIFTSLDKFKKYYKIPDDLNLHVSGYCKTYYDKNQTQLHEEFYHNDYIKEGLYKSYYKNGNIENESNYINGELNGISTYYKESGKIYFQHFYKTNNGIVQITPIKQ
jgi:antitoxin component YwqK of YwqJK toxin-antitoxin module